MCWIVSVETTVLVLQYILNKAVQMGHIMKLVCGPILYSTSRKSDQN